MSQSNTKTLSRSNHGANGLHNGLDHPNRKPLYQNNNNNSNGNSYGYGQMGNIHTIEQGFEMPSGIPTDLTSVGNYGQLKNLNSFTNSKNSGTNRNALPMQQYQLQQPQRQQQSMQQLQPQQQMPFNNGFPYGPRPYFTSGGYQGPMYPYSQQMSYPMYPPMSGFTTGMPGNGNPFVSPTNIPVDGFVTDFGGDFKVLGYQTAENGNNSQNPNMNFQNQNNGTHLNFNQDNMNFDKKFPMY